MDEEQKKALEALKQGQKEYKDAAEKVEKGLAEKADAKALNALSEKADKKWEDLETLTQAFEKAQKEGFGNKNEARVPETMAGFMHELSGELTSENGLKSLKAKKSETYEKAASLQTTTYSLQGPNAFLLRGIEDEAGIAKAPDNQPYIQELISIGATSGHTIFWTERILREGGAGQVAEAATFPQMSLQYGKKSVTTKKTAVYMTVTEEMLEDVDFIRTEMNTEMRDEMRSKIDLQLLSGDGTGENYLGIIPQAQAFARPAGIDDIVEANNADVLRVAIAQILINMKGSARPSAIVLHPADVVNMQLIKKADGTYLLPPFMAANGMQVDGIRIVANTGVAVGSFLVADFAKYKLFVRRQLTVKTYDNDFQLGIQDVVGISASFRGAARIKTSDLPAFVKGTFAAARPLLVGA